jgi:hypothetical protein
MGYLIISANSHKSTILSHSLFSKFTLPNHTNESFQMSSPKRFELFKDKSAKRM